MLPDLLIFQLQQEILKFNDVCVSWSSPKTDLVTFKYLTFLYVKTYLFLFFNCIKKHPSTENRCNFKIYKVTYSKLLLFLPTYGGSKNKQAYCILKAYRSSHQSCSIKKLRNIHGKKPVMKNICEWVLFELSNFLHINILSTLSNFFFFFWKFPTPSHSLYPGGCSNSCF